MDINKNTDITVTCTAGLGNRLINLYSSQDIYLKYGIRFKYYWPVQECVQPAKLNDIFSHKFEEFDGDYAYLTQIELQKDKGDHVLKREELHKKIHWISPQARFEEDLDLTNFKSAFNFIKIKSDILEKSNSLPVNKDVIGIHVRGGDLKITNDHGDDVRFISKKTMDKLLKKIETILATNKNQKFFVSCEDYYDKHIIEKKFSGNVMFLECERSRCSVLGIQHAIAELIILSRCSMIIGNIGSSFAGVAAMCGGIKHEIL